MVYACKVALRIRTVSLSVRLSVTLIRKYASSRLYPFAIYDCTSFRKEYRHRMRKTDELKFPETLFLAPLPNEAVEREQMIIITAYRQDGLCWQHFHRP